MSKVLVDRELLEKWTDKLEGADSAGYGWEDLLAAEIRGAIAQPVETEGVDFGFDDRSVKVSQEAYSIFLERERALQDVLSAVTAERDRLLAELERAYANYNQVSYASTERGKQIDQLRDEVEALRGMLGKSLPIVEAHAGASHMLEGFRPIRNKWDELVDGIRAAMAAKEAGPEHVCSGCGAKGWTGNCLECIPY